MGKEVAVDETKGQPKEELSNVEVQLDEQNNPVVPEKPKEEPKYVQLQDLEKVNAAINNTREYNNRRTASLEEKINQILKNQQAPAAVIKPSTHGQKDELDTMLEAGDWRTPVQRVADERAEAKFNELMKRQQEANRAEAEAYRASQLLENNKRQVLDRHKELNDEGSQKAQVYRSILQERPEYLTNPFGPVLAMRDMEDKLKEMGYVDDTTREIADKEILRRARAGASTVPTGQATNGTKKYTLTKEQKELCDLNGWKYESYAKHASTLNQKREIEA